MEIDTTLKPIAMIDGANPTEVMYFGTVMEAQDFVEKASSDSDTITRAHIYSLYSVGEPVRSFGWKLQADTATNLRETGKVKPARKGGWTVREEDLLRAAVKDGLGNSAIAKQLHRSVGSVYQKSVKLGIKGGEKKPRTARQQIEDLKNKPKNTW